LTEALTRLGASSLDWAAVLRLAEPWVQAVRRSPAPFWAMESLLKEYPISSAEGLALMRLAEALLRVPDAQTAVALTADQLGRADFAAHAPEGVPADSPHKLLAGLSSSAISLSRRFLPGAEADGGLLKRLGARTVVAAAVRAIQLLGRQFVLGRHIEEAMKEAAAQRKLQPRLRFSYDMLGEGARTEQDARRHAESYANAIRSIAAGNERSGRAALGPEASDGISIKLSALYSRYEEAQRERVFDVLLPRVWALIDLAAAANLNLTIDAEESDRLELSLDVFEALTARIAAAWPRWRGFGLAVQAYQTRALAVVDEVAAIARRHHVRFMVRLVKGAYWDGEVKRAQELGLTGYPVYTHKHHTDVSYLACAQAMLAQHEVIYSQFATHNAATIAAIRQLADATLPADGGQRYEMQRLHGMGEGVYREVLASTDSACRVYAPVGEHRDLLAYLVRRLLENGANSSFVHQLADEHVSALQLLASPLEATHATHDRPGLPLPTSLYGPLRRNAAGVDLACTMQRAPIAEALAQPVPVVGPTGLPMATVGQAREIMTSLQAAWPAWAQRSVDERAALLDQAADALETAMPRFVALLVHEGRKTQGDAVAEVREAVDFLRYYAMQARGRLADQLLPGPTGESNTLRLHGRGVFVCISPWNFPLAIFLGQVAAALVTGNAVAAKPAEQTPVVARAAVALLHEAGVPAAVLQLVHGAGEDVGAALVADRATAGVCFTGSTAVARHINRALAAKDGPIVPLIAETGGLNAMIVDSTALPEQVIDAVVQSAFRSAGQRCSALRLLCVHESIFQPVADMLRGAMHELIIGDTALLSTDVGPLIDDDAARQIGAHVQRLRETCLLLGETPAHALPPHTVAPVAFELPRVSDLREEIFGPVLHVVRWGGDPLAVVREINDLGYGLTFGIQTRIDSRAQALADAAHIGNVYVNRNMIGAVVGVQPFGGEGLSGTGPKAGGPHYLYRFCAEQTVTVNTAAAGGNAALLAGH